MSSNLYRKYRYGIEEGGVTYLEIEEDFICFRGKMIILDAGSQIVHCLKSNSLYNLRFVCLWFTFLRVNIPDKLGVRTQCFMLYLLTCIPIPLMNVQFDIW